jgi:hypothetical protein
MAAGRLEVQTQGDTLDQTLRSFHIVPPLHGLDRVSGSVQSGHVVLESFPASAHVDRMEQNSVSVKVEVLEPG